MKDCVILPVVVALGEGIETKHLLVQIGSNPQLCYFVTNTACTAEKCKLKVNKTRPKPISCECMLQHDVEV